MPKYYVPEEVLTLIFDVLHAQWHAIVHRVRTGSNAIFEDREVILGERKAHIRLLADIALASKSFYRLVKPTLYSLFPGQDIADPQMFLATLAC